MQHAHNYGLRHVTLTRINIRDNRMLPDITDRSVILMIRERRQLFGLDDTRNPSFDHAVKVKTSGENYYIFGETF